MGKRSEDGRKDTGSTAKGTEIPESLVGQTRDDAPNSLPDLVNRGVLDLELAGWLVAQVSGGASYIVGAGPGGVGKSTTMRSFLSFVPGHLPYAVALPGEITGLTAGPSCVVSHELSSHPPSSYLWGQDLRDFFGLSEQGHQLVGNMHTDSLEETRDQVCSQNDVPATRFQALNLLIFIGIEGAEPGAGRIKDTSLQRYLRQIVLSDGSADHEPVYTVEDGLNARAPRDEGREADCRAFLEDVLEGERLNVQQVRERFLARGA